MVASGHRMMVSCALSAGEPQQRVDSRRGRRGCPLRGAPVDPDTRHRCPIEPSSAKPGCRRVPEPLRALSPWSAPGQVETSTVQTVRRVTVRHPSCAPGDPHGGALPQSKRARAFAGARGYPCYRQTIRSDCGHAPCTTTLDKGSRPEEGDMEPLARRCRIVNNTPCAVLWRPSATDYTVWAGTRQLVRGAPCPARAPIGPSPSARMPVQAAISLTRAPSSGAAS